MVFAYSAEFWRLRVEEARALASQMQGSDAVAALEKVAEGYERIRLRCAHEEADIAFSKSYRKLNNSIGSASPEELALLWDTIDDKWGTLHQIHQELVAHIQAFPFVEK